MDFKTKWYSPENKPLDIPTFQNLQDVTGQAFDEFGNYVGKTEVPNQQLVIDKLTERQYYAPKEYSDDALRYAKAKVDKSFKPEDWYGMTQIKPHYKIGEHISAGYITALKSFAKPVAMLPTQLVYAGSVGLNALAKGDLQKTENLYRYSMQNWSDTLDKHGLGADPELSNMLTAKVGSIAGQTASSLLIAATVSSVGGLPAVATVFGSTQFADVLEEGLEKGLPHDKAVLAAFLAAVPEGGLEAVGFKMWSGAASLNKTFRNLALAFLWEGAQEGSQQIAESTITNLFKIREQTFFDIVADVALSALVGGLVGLGGAAISGQVEQRNIALKKEIGMTERGNIVPQKPADEKKAVPQKEGQVLNPSPEAEKQLIQQEIEEAKKTGDNKLYNTIKYVANANDVTDVDVIDKLYPICRKMIADGGTIDTLLDILGNQIVAYKNQLQSGQADNQANQKAVEEIKLATDPNRYEEWKESRKSELEKAGLSKEQAGTLSDHISRIAQNLSNRLGFDITEKKAVSFEPNLKAKAGTRGQITLGKTIAKIALNENADPTTVEHEFFHYIDSVVKDSAKEGNKEAQKLLKKRDDIIKKAKAELKKSGVTKFPSDEEIIASAYEKWLWNGAKSEDATEQKLFESIRDFFRDVYQSITGLLGVRISPEADAYFKAMTSVPSGLQTETVQQVSEETKNAEQEMTDVKEKAEQVKEMKPAEKADTLYQASGIELNAVSLNDPKQEQYVREMAKKYKGLSKLSDKTIDETISFAKYISEQAMKMGKAKAHDAFVAWNNARPDIYIDEKTGRELPVISAFKNNGDYPINFDFGTLCIKREPMDALVRHLLSTGLKRYSNQLGVTQMDLLKSILKKYGFQTACDCCFVEGKRLRQLIYANSLTFEWESVRQGIGMKDESYVGADIKLSPKQIKILEEMASPKTYKEAFKKYIPEDRKRATQGGKVLDSGITDSKMRSIAKLMLEDNSLVGQFNPEWLLSSAGVDWLMNRFGVKTGIGGFLGGMYGSATPKPIEGFSKYVSTTWAEKDTSKPAGLIEKLFNIGGARMQSFSDFNALLTIDNLQLFMDATLRGIPMQAYTKMPAFVKLFGDTGANINMSFVPNVGEDSDATNAGLKKASKEQIDAYNKAKKKGDAFLKQQIVERKIDNVYTDEQGNSWVYDWSEDSFPIEEAYQLRREYGHIGIIGVGISDSHIKMMLADPSIDMVIPFHSSGMPQHTKIVTGLGRRTADYESVQTTGGKPANVSDFLFNEDVHKTGDAKKSAENYKAWCNQNGYTPKYAQFADNENYYKLLEDFRSYDNEGKPVIQKAVNILNLNQEKFLNNLHEALGLREGEMNDIANIPNNEKLLSDVENVFRYQRIDGATRSALMKRLGDALGKDNVQSLEQSKFLELLGKELEAEVGAEEANKRIEVFREGQGYVYGFAKGDKIYLNENTFNAETPAHEFTHIWAKVAQKQNPKKWAEGVALLKKTQEWKNVMSDPLYMNIRADENAVARETLSRIVGQENARLINKILDPAYKEPKVEAGAIQKVLDWFKSLWNDVRDFFNLNDNGRKLTYEEFIHMPLRDLWDETRSKNFRNLLKNLQEREATSEMSAERKEKADTNSPEFKKWSNNAPLVKAEDVNTYNFKTGQSVVLEAFHGSGSVFDSFDEGRIGSRSETKGAFWFSDKDIADTYDEGVLYHVFIKAKNVFVYDYENASFDGTTYGYVARNKQTGEFLRDGFNRISVTDIPSVLENDAKELWGDNNYEILSNPKIKETTDDIAKWAKEQGYDGVVLKNVYDPGGMGSLSYPGTVYAVFSPTQIKSVYNRGTFSLDEDNIYYQQETQDQLFRNDQATKLGNKVLDKAPTNQEVEKELEAIRSGRVEEAQKAKRNLGLIDGLGDALLTVRQRVGVIDKRLKYAFDKLDYNEKMMESEYGKRTLPFIKKFRKLSDVDKKVLKYLIGNQQTERIREFLREHDMEQEYNDVRNLLDELFEEGNRAGMDMGFLQEYFPTKVADYKSFISYLMGTDKWSEIELALNQIDPNHQLSDEERADAINSILRGYNRLDPVGKKGFQKERKILHKTPEMLNYYMDVDEALMRYVSGMTGALAIRKAFNVKGAFNSEESIGGVVNELIKSGQITQKEEPFIKRMIRARLNYARTAPIVSLLKNFGYLGTMNSITSAVTQIGDLYASFYKYNFPTAMKAIFGKSEITKDDLYLDSVWEEFTDDGFTSVAVNKLFTAIGLNAFDKFGKNTAINGAWIDLKERAKNNDVSLLEDLTAAFGSQAGKVLADIKANNITSEVKLMLWSQLADTQPIGKSGTPVGYLSNGYTRIFYQLKTYTINQLSLFYADGLYKIQKGIATKNKKLFLQGTGNLAKLALLLTVFNAGADVLKNLIMGRGIEISDTLVSNMLWNLGVSKYTFYRGQRDGYARALFENFFPPQISMFDEAQKEARKIAKGKKKASDTIAVTYVPVVGRMWYWWFGGGRTAEKKKGNKPFQVKL